MLNIGSINTFRRLQTNGLLKPLNITKPAIQNKYSNLAPLSCDTVSFKGAKQREPLNEALMEAFDNKTICEEIYANGKVVADDFRVYLNEIMKPYRYNPESNPEGVVENTEVRVKQPSSIREKAADKLAWAIKHDTTQTFDPEKTNAIKEKCNDIIGGRIILRNPTQKKTKKIIDTLIGEVQKGKLKILKIENYSSDSLDKKYEYFHHSDLDRLCKAVNDKYRQNISIINNNKTTGYMALHIDVDLSNPEYISKNDGYSGEIQIVGRDVSELKDTEDLCYKLKQGKRIKNGHPAYYPFSEYFKKHINNPKYPNLKEDFDLYTKKAYEIQRLKEPVEGQSAIDSHLPTIKECGMQGKIPPELDFNKIHSVNVLCKAVHDVMEGII